MFRSAPTCLAAAILVATATLLGCGSDDTTPATLKAPPQGAVSVTFEGTATAGKTCNIATHTMTFGSVSDGGRSLITAGEDGSTFNCSVKEAGGVFAIDIDFTHDKDRLTVTAASLSPAATEASPSEARVTFSSDKTVKTYISLPGQLCNMHFLGSQNVEPGSLWASFDCPSIENASSASACLLAHSAVAFQGCDL